ncbi:glycosyltransferase [Desulfococcaceae bacterium HSG7]|nr:glycosyltransferase [Desulfococcaceae bacterium HSG7]
MRSKNIFLANCNVIKPMHILVATNNFHVGGRETFIYNYINYLKEKNNKASLITSGFMETPETGCFDRIIKCGTENYAQRWRAWLQKAEEYFRCNRISIIWAHHYDLLPVWLISKIYRVPVVTTFHGPLLDAGRPNDPMQALGMTMAIHRENAVSGVSKEVISGIKNLAKCIKNKIYIIPNAVAINPTAMQSDTLSKPIRFIIISRPEKLEHIRKAAQIFNFYQNKFGRSFLLIAGGETPNDRGEKDCRAMWKYISKVKTAIKYLGGKWCYKQGISFFRNLNNISFYGYTSRSKELIRNSDVVFGMGRVLLEGLAEGKPGILVGYKNAHGIVTKENFETFRYSNFSGRGVSPQTTDDICNAIADFHKTGHCQDLSCLDSVSIENCGNKLEHIFKEIINSYSFQEDEVDFAKKLSQKIISYEYNSAKIFSRVCNTFTPQELYSLYKLIQG